MWTYLITCVCVVHSCVTRQRFPSSDHNTLSRVPRELVHEPRVTKGSNTHYIMKPLTLIKHSGSTLVSSLLSKPFLVSL